MLNILPTEHLPVLTSYNKGRIELEQLEDKEFFYANQDPYTEPNLVETVINMDWTDNEGGDDIYEACVTISVNGKTEKEQAISSSNYKLNPNSSLQNQELYLDLLTEAEKVLDAFVLEKESEYMD